MKKINAKIEGEEGLSFLTYALYSSVHDRRAKKRTAT